MKTKFEIVKKWIEKADQDFCNIKNETSG